MEGPEWSDPASKPEDRIMAELCLSRIPWVGPSLGRRLMEYFGGPQEVLGANRQELFQLKGIARRAVDSIQSAPDPEVYQKEAEWVLRNGIRTWLIGDEDYPERLGRCPDAPVLLFGKGDLELDAPRMVSIVGTRNISPYGRAMCKGLIQGLAPYDVVVVSGLAFGIDIQAHRSAMKEGLSTIAVAGHGLDRVYPLEHTRDLEEMLERGGMITEFPAGSLPDRHHFPKRNRIVAGITDCTVVVETSESGGAMITADIAHSYERDVLAFPGRAEDRTFRGCNRLVKEHKAFLIENAEDLLHWMNWDEATGKEQMDPEEGQKDLFLGDLSEEERSLVRIVQQEGRISLDGLSVKAEIPVSRLSPLLLGLELKGVLNSLPGKIYVAAGP